jgi:anti-sigma regulatory factor (Ser/Thr protein kinase)
MIRHVGPMADATEDALRVRFAADPASVPAARRFVADGLESWEREALIDDATLCVSELAGNAALHGGSTFMDVVLQSLGEAVRLSVEDDGEVPVEAVAPRASYPEPETAHLSLDDEPTTGRGLAIVAALARKWGVEATAVGKRVWAELTAEPHYEAVAPRTDPAADPAFSGEGMPPGWALVRLAGCPVALSLRQDDHLDELVRELQLISADDDSHSRALSAQIQDLLISPAHARFTGRRLAEQAQEAGLAEVDIEMAMPHEVSILIRRLQRAVMAADDLCERMELLTVASPPELRELRAWMTHELVAQIERREPPVTWADWLRRPLEARHPQEG